VATRQQVASHGNCAPTGKRTLKSDGKTSGSKKESTDSANYGYDKKVYVRLVVKSWSSMMKWISTTGNPSLTVERIHGII
jgi:hypothetical protein